MSSRLTPPKDGGGHNVARVLGIQADRNRVHAAQMLEEQRLPLHQRQPGDGLDILLGIAHLQTLHPRAVRDDGHRVAPAGVFVGQVLILLNGAARGRHAGRVPNGEVVHDVLDGASRRHLYLAAIERVQTQRVPGRLLGLGEQVLLSWSRLHLQKSLPVK